MQQNSCHTRTIFTIPKTSSVLYESTQLRVCFVLACCQDQPETSYIIVVRRTKQPQNTGPTLITGITRASALRRRHEQGETNPEANSRFANVIKLGDVGIFIQIYSWSCFPAGTMGGRCWGRFGAQKMLTTLGRMTSTTHDQT